LTQRVLPITVTVLQCLDAWGGHVSLVHLVLPATDPQATPVLLWPPSKLVTLWHSNIIRSHEWFGWLTSTRVLMQRHSTYYYAGGLYYLVDLLRRIGCGRYVSLFVLDWLRWLTWSCSEKRVTWLMCVQV